MPIRKEYIVEITDKGTEYCVSHRSELSDTEWSILHYLYSGAQFGRDLEENIGEVLAIPQPELRNYLINLNNDDLIRLNPLGPVPSWPKRAGMRRLDY